MCKLQKFSTIEQSVDMKAAVNEREIKTEELILELKPFIEDYFIGSFKVEGNKLNIEFLNGQNFILTVL